MKSLSVKTSKKEVEGEGAGVSQYSKMEIDHEYWTKEGVARPSTDEEKTTRDKMESKITNDASRKLTKREIKRAGRRSDG